MDQKTRVAVKYRSNVGHGYYFGVPICVHRSATSPSPSFHAFPSPISRPQVRGAWIHAIRRDRGKDFKVTSNTRVCSAHFRESDYRVSAYAGTAASSIELGKRNLVPNAVPSLFEWNSSLHPGLKPKAPAEGDPLPSSNRREKPADKRLAELERTRRTVERTSCSELEYFRRNQPYEHISTESKSTLQRRNCECRSRLLASAGGR